MFYDFDEWVAVVSFKHKMQSDCVSYTDVEFRDKKRDTPFTHVTHKIMMKDT